MILLKPIDYEQRKPTKQGRYVIQYYGGGVKAKNWIERNMEFGRVANNTSIKYWYQEIQLPTPSDMHFVVESLIPSNTHPRERELMLKGARIAMEYLEKMMKEA